MSIQAFRIVAAATALLLAMMFTCPAVHAQMSGGGDAPKTASSAGQTMPDVVDLAGDPAWQMQELGQEGIRYLQINHSTNGAHADMAQVDATVWVIQTDTQPPVMGYTVYRDKRDEVVHYRQSNQDRWIVIPVPPSR